MAMPRVTLFWVLGWAALLAASFWPAAAVDGVEKRCNISRYPELCVETLREMGSLGHVDAVTALVQKIIKETEFQAPEFAVLSSQFEVQDSERVRSVTEHCTKQLGMSQKRLNQSLKALAQSPRNKEDIQTWLSAALTFQEWCKDAAESVGLSGDLAGLISRKMEYLSKLASNALALANGIPGGEKRRHLAASHVPFPLWMSRRERRLLQAAKPTVQANAVVAADGSGNFKTVSEAILAASGKSRFVIYVKAGLYKEKIHVEKDGITLIGDGKYATRIVGGDSVGNGASLYKSATVTIGGDGFIARDIGFENTAGPKGLQALALNVAGDRTAFFRCAIKGYQDTLFASALRQFYRECEISGTVDFIFGNAAAVFQSCDIVLLRQEAVIMANGRTDPGQNTGFTLQSCRIAPAPSVSSAPNSFLGRPWKEYSRAVVMQTSMTAISGKGWVNWSGADKSRTKTLYFAEYANTGPGASIGGRVQWPGFHVLTPADAAKFTVSNFIAGRTWLPSTGVTFVPDLA